MSPFTTIRYRLEYGAARVLFALADALPMRGCEALGTVAGNLAFLFAPRRRAIAMENILRAGMAADPPAARSLARQSFRHFALLVMETLKAQRALTPATLARHVTFDLPAATAALLDDPAQGLLVACGHFGNWEVLGPIVGFRKPAAAIAKPMENPLVENLVRRRTPDSRFQIVPKQLASMLRLVALLREGRALGVMIDQYALKRPILVEFLGRPACSPRGIAVLHRGTRAPIVYASCRRTGPLQFAVRFSEPLQFPATGDKEKDTFGVLKALNERLEADIRAAPEQYLWSHRRWRPPKPWAFGPRHPG